MRRLFPILIVVATVSSCTVNTCDKTDFDIQNSPLSQSGFLINVYTADHGFYEVQYGANGFDLGSGTVQQVNNQTIVNVPNGAYDVFLRGNCGADDWSDWTGPKSIFVEGNTSYCDPPGNVNHFESGPTNHFTWTQSFADFFEVEFGPTGFTHGTGTNESINTDSYSTTVPQSGATYDFYVRANCGGTSWSDWVGPVSFVGG